MKEQQDTALLKEVAALYARVMRETYATMCQITDDPPPSLRLDVIALEHKDPHFWKQGQSGFILLLHEAVMDNPTLSAPLKKMLKDAAEAGKKIAVFPQIKVAEPRATPQENKPLVLTGQDKRFLKSLRISPDDSVVVNSPAHNSGGKQH